MASTAAAGSTTTLILVFITAALSITTPAMPVSRDTACAATLYPSICRSNIFVSTDDDHLPSQTPVTYAFISSSVSLATSHTHLDTLSNILKENRPSTLPRPQLLALQNCQYLAERNVELLSSSDALLRSSAASELSENKAIRIHSQLSSALANMQACLDDLGGVDQTAGIQEVCSLLGDGSKVYRVGLDLFGQAWELPKKEPTLVSSTDHDYLPPADSSDDMCGFSGGRRGLLQMKVFWPTPGDLMDPSPADDGAWY